MIIDAHHHLWDRSQPFDYRWLEAPTHSPIRRDFTPDDLEHNLRSARVDRAICVQTQHDVAETRWALRLAERHAFMAGVVGWVDLRSHACETQLLEFLDHPKFVGVRHLTQDEPEDDFLIHTDVLKGLQILQRHAVPFDLLIHPRHLPHVPTLARALPDLPMVIDHLAKPDIKGRRFDHWRDELRVASAFRNVHAKLSGLATEADWTTWTPNDLAPYIQEALDAFGPTRLMFGSDWPVCELAGSYGQILDALNEVLGPLSSADRAAIFGGTATRFYRLSP